MSVQYNAEFFRARSGQPFRVADAALELELQKVTETRYSTPDHPSFSLIFRGPASPQLEQRTYAFVCADATALDIFIVPVARTAAGVEYEAVFN